MRITAQGSGCAPPRPLKQTAVPGVGARNGRKSEQASKPLTHSSNHKPRALTRQTMIALFSDEGAFIGYSLFGQQSDARAFLRAGGAS
ncbi:hypothetical protein MBUL_01459 [Methylobacterium bullatum]|uniref:Uncharacterized protein n=1 Tax=Methylobacterium bullatum TaxID=570505 RepID=A0A679J735_9HYPH|nr:hypothetical protein MBUL_01459 [Methylobacterium bullatum]